MQRLFFSVILLVVAASARAGEVDQLYVIDCGWAHATKAVTIRAVRRNSRPYRCGTRPPNG